MYTSKRNVFRSDLENIISLTLYKVQHIQQKFQQTAKFQWKHILLARLLAINVMIIFISDNMFLAHL